jgi:tRNA(Ile)-lysidine synthase
MITALKAWLTKEIGEWQNKRFVIAISGGIDSVVLANLFYDLRVEFELAHCNFKLRGGESDQDETFVRDLSKSLRVKCHVKLFDTQVEAEKMKLSIQETARELRYTWFERLRLETNCDYIVVGTHKSDQTETILINMLRGSGRAGLHGILPNKNKVIRPLLEFDRSTIISYAKKHEIHWREDSSNASTKYLRNKLRHDVIPILKEINPNLEDRFSTNAKQIQDSEDVLQKELDRKRPLILNKTKQGWELSKYLLLQTSNPTFYLHAYLRDYGFTFSQCQTVVKHINNNPGAVYTSSEYTLLNDRHFLMLSSTQEVFLAQKITKGLTALNSPAMQFEFEAYLGQKPNANETVAEIDAAKLKFPLTLRPWQQGDKFKPLGMSGFKKISDFLIDTKTPLTQKQNVLVLESNGKIVWVVGMRLDDRFKLAADTREIYRVVLGE